MRVNENGPGERWREAAMRLLPVFSPDEQAAGIVLHRALSKGRPVTVAEFAEALGVPTPVAETLIDGSSLTPFILLDEARRVRGFWGLSTTPTRHRLTVNGRTSWTWCAADSLFLPELIGDTAVVESRDPETEQPVRLTVSPERIEAAEPSGMLVSIGRPESWDMTSAARVILTACHFIFFFAARSSGEHWQAKHPEPATVLLSLDEAFDFARRTTAHSFGTELARRREGVA